MTTVAEVSVEQKFIGGPHGLDTRNHIPVPVFVPLGDGGIVQVGPLVRKGDEPVRPPWYEGRLETRPRESISDVEPGGAVLVQEDEIGYLGRVEVVPPFVAEGRLCGRPAEGGFSDGH